MSEQPLSPYKEQLSTLVHEFALASVSDPQDLYFFDAGYETALQAVLDFVPEPRQRDENDMQTIRHRINELAHAHAMSVYPNWDDIDPAVTLQALVDYVENLLKGHRR